MVPKWSCRTRQCPLAPKPSKVLPLFTYVAHMDLVCPRCMPTKAANLPAKQTCPVHRLDLMLSISSSAGAYLKMGRRWREMLVTLGISNPDAWVRYAAKYATLPPLPAQLALPASVWSIVSSTVLLYLQPSLLAVLAERMRWAFEPCQHTEVALHFAGFTGEALSAKPIFGSDFEPHSGVIHKSQFCWKAASYREPTTNRI